MDALEHRAHRRWPTWLHAVVQPESESSGRGGLILDLSLGGAAIEMGDWPEDKRGMLGLLGDGLRYLIPFVVVGVETTMRGTLVHAEFDGIDERCEAFLADLLESAEVDFGHSQWILANRPND
jgi:PilZ domain